MAQNLLAAGRWLKYAGDCVYATVRIVHVCDETQILKYTLQDYWCQVSQDPAGSYRFLTTPETFCVVALNKPVNGSVIVDAGGVVFPIQKGDAIRLLGPTNGTTARGELEWDIDQNGILTIDVPQSQVDQVDYAWAFQVTYASDS